MITMLSSAVAAMFIAILSGLGVGSGGLLVIWLTAVEGMNTTEARGLNLLFFVFSASAALFIHLRRDRLNLAMVSIFALFATVGTVLGSLLGLLIDPFILRKIFGAMLVASGGYSFWTRIRSLWNKNTVLKTNLEKNK